MEVTSIQKGCLTSPQLSPQSQLHKKADVVCSHGYSSLMKIPHLIILKLVCNSFIFSSWALIASSSCLHPLRTALVFIYLTLGSKQTELRSARVRHGHSYMQSCTRKHQFSQSDVWKNWSPLLEWWYRFQLEWSAPSLSWYQSPDKLLVDPDKYGQETCSWKYVLLLALGDSCKRNI